MKIGFDNNKYLTLQAQHIRARREQFGDKLYIEFGGKLFDDYHASRVLPGFQPDSKIRMLASIRDDVEIVVAICAGDIEKKKVRGDLGIGYDEDVLRLMDVFRGLGFYVGSVVITQYAGQPQGGLKTLLTLLTMAGWMDKSSDLYQVMFNIADATFYFLPVMIAYTSATKLKCNKMYAVIIAAVPLLPKLSGLIGDGLTIFGLTVPNVSYTSQIFPAILSVFALYFVEKYFTKICPKPVRVIFVPVVCFLVVVPLELLFLGPLGYNAGVAFTSCLLALYGSVGWVVVAVLAAVLPFMTAVGMHKALLPYITATYVDPGYDMLNAPAKTAHNISECGACFAVALKSKNPDTKSVALSAAISALFGISEPALYGVTLQNKRAMVGVVTGSFISALVMGIVGVKSFTLMSTCLIGMPQFVDEANPANFIWACVGFAIAIGVSFVVTMVLYRDEELKEVSEAQKAVLREMGM